MCTSVYFLNCGHTLTGLTCVCPQCHQNVSAPIDVNAVLFCFFSLILSLLPFHFVFVRMQMSLIKFVLYKKKKYIVAFVCNIALLSVAKPTSHGKQKTQQVGFWGKIR